MLCICCCVLAVVLQAIDFPCTGIFIYTVCRLDQFDIAGGYYLFGLLKEKSYCPKPWMEILNLIVLFTGCCLHQKYPGQCMIQSIWRYFSAFKHPSAHQWGVCVYLVASPWDLKSESSITRLQVTRRNQAE